MESVPLSDGRIAEVRPMKAGQMFQIMRLDADDAPAIIGALARTATVEHDGGPAWADDEAVSDAPFADVKAVADAALRVNALTELGAELLGND